jgi:hypothetical protein
MKHVLPDNGGRRSDMERRQFLYNGHIPERRSGKERRSGLDRRKQEYQNNKKYFKQAGSAMALPFYFVSLYIL